MTNLEKLENDIREKLPRLQELTEGCIVLYNSKPHVLVNVVQTHDEYELYIKGRSSFTTGSRFLTPIGHDILLSDVLEWLCHNENSFNIECNRNGICFMSYCWNLSKPYLKDQPKELIYYLASLI